jgi:hypothetical protein
MRFQRIFILLFLSCSIACVEGDIDEINDLIAEELVPEEKVEKSSNEDPCRINLQSTDKTYSIEGKWSFLSYKELGSDTYMDNWTCVAQIAHYVYNDENLPLILNLTENELGNQCESSNTFQMSLFLSHLTSCYKIIKDEEIEFNLEPEDAVYTQDYCFMSQCGYDLNFYKLLQKVRKYEIKGNQLRLFPEGKDYTLWFVAVDEDET